MSQEKVVRKPMPSRGIHPDFDEEVLDHERGLQRTLATSLHNATAHTVVTSGAMKQRTCREDLEEDTLPDSPPPGWAEP